MTKVLPRLFRNHAEIPDNLDPKQPILLTNDSYLQPEEAVDMVHQPGEGPDHGVFVCMPNGSIKQFDDANALVKFMHELRVEYEDMLDMLRENMTDQLANAIRQWRCVDKKSWRALSLDLLTMLGVGNADFNQMVGQAACKMAAARLGEDNAKAPWN